MYLNEQKAKQWTSIALDCLKRKCQCEGCFYDNFFKRSQQEGSNQKCQMKQSVIQLIRVFGTPKDIEQPTITNDVDLGFWDINGNYIEDKQKISERDF